MKLDLTFGTALCYCSTFSINGVVADADDFGHGNDDSPDDADEPGACGDRRFHRKDPRPDVLVKYGINENDYDFIATKLEEGLSFGSCGWCV